MNDATQTLLANEADKSLAGYLATVLVGFWMKSADRMRALGITVNFGASKEGAACLRNHLQVNNWSQETKKGEPSGSPSFMLG